MLQGTNSSGGDNWHGDSSRNQCVQRQVVPLLRTVPIHTCEENFARTLSDTVLCPFYYISACRRAPTVDKHFISTRHGKVCPGVDGKHDALRTKLLRTSAQQVRVLYRCCIQRGLIRTR